MTERTFLLADSATMLRRNLLHARRYPSLTLMVAAIPVLFLLLFVYVFGSTLGDGLPGTGGGRDAYIAYVVPGVLLMAIAGSATSTAIAVGMDMHEGIVDRFRTMSIPRGAVLTGHVLGSGLQTIVSLAMVMAVALLIGFRPTTGPVEITAAIGLLVLVTFAITWLSVPLGLVSDSVEAASNLPMPLMFLPFLGSGFVPTESMPDILRWFADYQPFTSIIETLRGLLLGTPIGWSAAAALGWCVLITVAGYLWSMRLYDRRSRLR